MRPCLRVHLPLKLLLNPVITDRRRGVQSISDVRLAQLRQIASLRCVVGPDARIAVGLKLDPHGCARRALRIVTDSIENAGEILHVMPILMCEHVGFGERAALSAKLRAQLVKEPEVEVDRSCRLDNRTAPLEWSRCHIP